ncbi:hypothetical protein C942_04109 [Photobacterium marinum]|uniref:Uncharacterized protein n=1 Tax=Photobacterium marinum TaxID=1056511 RepID=L8J2K9_9GAMM|nr:hypothetical protein [Photobacterium marinum]ELR63095.1 hypothetical protein C942_04109 [Photobacterium marinum]
MKRYILSAIGIVVVFTVLYGSFDFYRSSYLSTNIENGSYEKCFNDSNLKSFNYRSWGEGDLLAVRFVDSGNKGCFAPKFPSIEVTSPQVTHWIHIVSTNGNVQLSGKHSSFGSNGRGWQFVDVGSQSQRDSSIPFYSVNTAFRDNPAWSVAPHVTLDWVGTVFGLSEQDGVLYSVGGLSWGFTLQQWTLEPKAIPPQVVDKEAWLAVVDDLAKEYPNYKFSRHSTRT